MKRAVELAEHIVDYLKSERPTQMEGMAALSVAQTLYGLDTSQALVYSPEASQESAAESQSAAPAHA